MDLIKKFMGLRIKTQFFIVLFCLIGLYILRVLIPFFIGLILIYWIYKYMIRNPKSKDSKQENIDKMDKTTTTQPQSNKPTDEVNNLKDDIDEIVSSSYPNGHNKLTNEINQYTSFVDKVAKVVYNSPHTVDDELFSSITVLTNDFAKKQAKTMELLEKCFNPNGLTYNHYEKIIHDLVNRFMNKVFYMLHVLELDPKYTTELIKQFENDINNLEVFIDKFDKISIELLKISYTDEDNGVLDELDDAINNIKNYKSVFNNE